MKELTPDDVMETQIDQWVEDKHKRLVDLGWMNAGGQIGQLIDAKRHACRLMNHRPTDADHSFYNTGADHRVTCWDCGYIYHYDSSG